MSKNAFADLLIAKPKLWEQPMASKKLDKEIAKPEIQRGIAKKKENHQQYGIIESNIVGDYAQLVDNKLRLAFLNIPMNDFRTASGFTDPKKASAAVKEYAAARAYLSFFVKQDINQHKGSPDAKLSAFRRWVSVSNLLLQMGSYEGFQIVFTNLQALVTPQLEHGLPLPLLKEYNRMCQLNSPYKNKAALRHYMEDEQHERSLTPLFLRFQDINTLNENIEQTQDKVRSLENRIQILTKNISWVTKKIENNEEPIPFNVLLEEKKTKLARCQRILIKLNADNDKTEQTQDKISRLKTQVRMLNTKIGRLTKQIENNEEPKPFKERLEEKKAKLARCQRIIKIKRLEADKAIQSFEEARMTILVSIAHEKSQPVTALPEHLVKTYSKICANYKPEEEQDEVVVADTASAPASPRGHKREKTSTLYSRKMLPSFFTKPEKHWEEVYQMRPRGASI